MTLVRTAAVAMILAAALTRALHAQDPIPPRPIPRDTLRADTIRADTIRTDTIRTDTLRADTLAAPPADSVRPLMVFPPMPHTAILQPALMDWVWDRDALMREMAVNLLDLLERIPGITTFRAGTLVQPEAASAFAGTVGRTEVIVDGYTLDPLAARTLDLSQVTLGEVREVRVQRRLGLLRIILTTEYAAVPEPYSKVEAGIGVPEANMFRGMFTAPHVVLGPLAFAIERIDTDGISRSEPAGLFNTWAKLAWTNDVRGVQFEMNRRALDRKPQSPWVIDRTRQDMVLRLRNRFATGFVGELYLGRSVLDETAPAVDTLPERRTERESVQGGLRAALDYTRVGIDAALRFRTLDNLPLVESTIDATTSLGPLTLGGEFGAAGWEGHRTRTYMSLRGEVGRYFGLAAFGELTAGERGAPDYGNNTIAVTERDGWRAGLSLDLGLARGNVALIHIDEDATLPFGLSFDSLGVATPVEAADGIEAYGRVEIWRNRLALSSWITDWRELNDWTWLPRRSWRTALELHWIPLRSGNLEIFGRAEAHMRGATRAPHPASTPDEPGFVTLPSFTTVDGYLQIRIIDVRMFVRWEDWLNRDIVEVPGRAYRGPRIFYGVKWQLRN